MCQFYKDTTNHMLHNDGSEKQLLQWIADGSEAAFHQFYDSTLSYVTNVVRLYHEDMNLAVEDLVQEIFLSIWKYRSNLTAVKNIKYYLFKTAKNKVVQFQMAAAKRACVNLDNINSNYLQQPPQDELDYKLLLNIYRQTVQTLPGRQQKVLQLRYEAGLSREEVGAQMGIAISTVKNLNLAAKQKLRCALGRVMK